MVKKAINESNNNRRKIFGVVTFAKDGNEYILLNQKIQSKLQEMPDIDIVFINSGKTILGEDKFANWVEYKSTAHYYAGKDNDQAAQNTAYANDILNT